MSMKIIKVNPELSPKEQLACGLNNSIFLAGPCPRTDYKNDWRYKAFEILERLGFDLAADYHNFTPISMEQVEWFANAIQYWDHNVFCEKASVYGL